MPKARETVLEFPCEFPIKAMGRVGIGLENILFNIVRELDPEFTAKKMHIKPSPQGKYVSVTLHIQAISQQQLDSIYQNITACESVLFTL
jgi:putative lipoic acid-binding regulatory protein